MLVRILPLLWPSVNESRFVYAGGGRYELELEKADNAHHN
jgi:hypothetical protein